MNILHVFVWQTSHLRLHKRPCWQNIHQTPRWEKLSNSQLPYDVLLRIFFFKFICIKNAKNMSNCINKPLHMPKPTQRSPTKWNTCMIFIYIIVYIYILKSIDCSILFRKKRAWKPNWQDINRIEASEYWYSCLTISLFWSSI